MFKLVDVPEGYILSNPNRGKLGVTQVDYIDYIEIVMKFVDTGKPYMMVEIIDRDPWLTGNVFITRLRTAIDLAGVRHIVRAGYVSKDRESHFCLYRRDMGY